jgi:nitrogen fixation protein NifU and related proteins
MHDDLRDLYQEVILDHGRRPRNLRAIAGASARAQGHNPLCGDQIKVYLTLGSGDVVTDASFEGKGCAISVASASLMTELVRGRTLADVERLFGGLHHLCTGQGEAPSTAGIEDAMEKLDVLSGVREFPVRVKCATLAWHTMQAALAGREKVSTE